jgi:hypothetical protein
LPRHEVRSFSAAGKDGFAERLRHTTTLAEDFGVADANEDDRYAAMDWLLARQDAIQVERSPCRMRSLTMIPARW